MLTHEFGEWLISAIPAIGRSAQQFCVAGNWATDIAAGSILLFRRSEAVGSDLIRTSIYDEYLGSMKITAHLDRIGPCQTASGTN